MPPPQDCFDWFVWQRTTLLCSSITLLHACRLSARATHLMLPKIRPLTPQRSCIILWADTDYVITNTSSPLPKMVLFSILVNSHFPLAHTPPSQRPLGANLLIVSQQSIWILSMLTLHLATVFLLVDSNMPSSLSTKRLVTTGPLGSNLYNTVTFYQHSSCFRTKGDPLHDDFNVTVMKSCLVAPYDCFFMSTSHPLLPVPQDANLPTDLWNCIGRLWFTCREPTLPRNKCLKHFGTTQLNILHE
jgi:hypothetical protein